MEEDGVGAEVGIFEGEEIVDMREVRGGCNWRGREDVGYWGLFRDVVFGGNWGFDLVFVVDYGIRVFRLCRFCFGLEFG